MKLMFIGADHEVTGSCHYLEACGKRILVDYGMEQGVNVFENVELPVQESLIDYVLLTHAHIDHSGMLPALYAKGFRGRIFTTEATADLCSIMLRDCAHIQQQEAEWKNRKAKRSSHLETVEPAYTMEDADGAIRCLVPCAYGQKVELCEGIEIRFTDRGMADGGEYFKEDRIFRRYRKSGSASYLRSGLYGRSGLCGNGVHLRQQAPFRYKTGLCGRVCADHSGDF